MKKFRFMCTVALVMGVLLMDREGSYIYQAATSYTNAKKFYNSTGLESTYIVDNVH